MTIGSLDAGEEGMDSSDESFSARIIEISDGENSNSRI